MSSNVWKVASAALGCTTVAATLTAASVWPASSEMNAEAAVTRSPQEMIQSVRRGAAACAPSAAEADALVSAIANERSPHRVRVLVEQLRWIGGERAVVALRPMLDDPRPGVSEAAAVSLGYIGTAAAVEALAARAYDGASRQREEAIHALALAPGDRAFQVLESIATDRLSSARSAAIAALGESGRTEAVPLLEQLSRDNSTDVASKAVLALGLTGRPEADAIVQRLGREGTGPVRVAALTSLAEPGSPESLRLLGGLLRSSRPMDVNAAARTLARSGEPAAFDLLREAFQGAQAVTVLSAISADPNPGVEPLLLEALRGQDLQLRWTAGSALVRVGSEEGIDELLSMARHGAPEERSFALSALQASEGPEVEAIMFEQAQSGPYSERGSALGWLIDRGHPQSVSLAAGMATTGDWSHRAMGIQLLTRHMNDEARGVLLDLARHGAPEERQMVLESFAYASTIDEEVESLIIDAIHEGGSPPAMLTTALASSGTERARTTLVELTQHRRSDVVVAATQALTQLDGPEVSAALEEIVANADEASARGMALYALTRHSPERASELAEGFLESGDSNLVNTALSAMFRADPEGGTERAREFAESDAAPESRAMAVRTLASRGEPGDLEPFVRDESPEVRAAALNVISYGRVEAPVDLFLTAMSDDSSEVRVAAVQGLSQVVDDPAVDDVLAQAIGDEDENVAMRAIWASHRSEAALGPILGRLMDEGAPETVRRAAAAALRRSGAELSPEQESTVESLYEDPFG